MADEEDWQIETILRAQREYIEFVPDMSDIWRAFRLKSDVTLKWFQKVVYGGYYFFLKDETKEKGGDALVYVVNQDIETIEIEGDIREILAEASFDYEGPDLTRKGPISLWELEVWAAENMLAEEGDTERARKLLLSTYHDKDGKLLSEIEKEQQAVEQPPKQDTKRPRSYPQAISKVSQKITEVDITAEKVGLAVGGKNETDVVTYITLSYAVDDVSLSRRLEPFDRIVHNAVGSLWNAGNRVITVAQVYRAMTGSKIKIPKAPLERIEKSLDKQRITLVSLDFSAELRGKTVEYDGETITADKAKAETYMLNASKTTVDTANGRRAVGYIINEPPVLYRHAKITGQMITHPQRLLEETSKKIGNKETDLLIRDYLLQRIKPMGRKGSRLSKQIKFKTIYDNIGASVGTNRAEVKRLNDRIKRCLDALKDLGVILGYEEYRDGRSHKLVGVTVEVSETQN